MTEAISSLSAGKTAVPVATPAAVQVAAPAPGRDEQLMKTAKAFEAVFVAQMLSQSGLGKAIAADGGFGGEAFSSLLVEQYSNKLVEKGGFGLAERIYDQLRQQDAPRAERTIS